MVRVGLCVAALSLATPVLAAQGGVQNSTNQSSGNASGGAGGNAAVVAIVNSEFPAYDANGSGLLEQPEFVKWMIALKDQEMKATGRALPASEISAWAAGAFTSADADGDGQVSKTELIAYLTGR
ncbi:MAG: hypothetical protein DI547_06935 [Sphingobium sp.]|nr:MAG: hypothetical protein DI547_06935 [Sphingobium sp.]